MRSHFWVQRDYSILRVWREFTVALRVSCVQTSTNMSAGDKEEKMLETVMCWVGHIVRCIEITAAMRHAKIICTARVWTKQQSDRISFVSWLDSGSCIKTSIHNNGDEKCCQIRTYCGDQLARDAISHRSRPVTCVIVSVFFRWKLTNNYRRSNSSHETEMTNSTFAICMTRCARHTICSTLPNTRVALD